MDCAAEEQMIRQALRSEKQIERLRFDLAQQCLTVYHRGKLDPILAQLKSLGLPAILQEQGEVRSVPGEDRPIGRQMLWWVLIINFSFFLIEGLAGWLANSMGLLADALDMLADALVYGLSLYALNRSLQAQKNVARAAGYFQIILAAIGFSEVVRRFFQSPTTPDVNLMILISFMALLANAGSWLLLNRTGKEKPLNIQASMIFTANDVLINLGVIISAVLVYYLQNPWPDLIIGAVVFLLVLRGAKRILALGKSS